MDKKEYAKLLDSPEWQKKRLKIMERDNYCCTLCMDGDSKLNVHHKKYISGKAPWDYPDHYLTTLCENCHWVDHSKEIERAISALTKSGVDEATILKALDKRMVDFAKDFHPELFKFINLDDALRRYQSSLTKTTV